jgi:hypothetical protein
MLCFGISRSSFQWLLESCASNDLFLGLERLKVLFHAMGFRDLEILGVFIVAQSCYDGAIAPAITSGHPFFISIHLHSCMRTLQQICADGNRTLTH